MGAVGFMGNKDKEEEKEKEKEKEEEKEKEKEKEKEEEKEKEKEKEDKDKEGMDDEMKKLMMMMPMAGKYQCYEGFKMHKTMKGDMGWCRKGGSFEVPRCESVKTWSEIQFKLHNGRENRFVKNGKAYLPSCVDPRRA